jgi:hypothetical protein
MGDTYEYQDRGGRRYKRPVRSQGYARGAGEDWSEDTSSGSGKSTGAVKGDLGFKASGSDPDNLSDAEIDKLSPIMRGSARAKRAAALKKLAAE